MMRHTSGFTLIEVMVALVVVGMTLPVFLLRMQSLLNHTDHMNSKTYAFWLAENKMQEILIRQQLQGNVTKTRRQEDEEDFAGQPWHWKVEIEPTPVEQMFRVEISVGLTPDEPLATLAGFLRE